MTRPVFKSLSFVFLNESDLLSFKTTAEPAHLKSSLPVLGGTRCASRHRHGDVAGHLHLPGLFCWLLVGLGPRRHALLFLQLPAAPAEAPARGEAEGAVSAYCRDGAAQLPPRRVPTCCSSTTTTATASTAAQRAATVQPSSDSVASSSATCSPSIASSDLGQHAR